ncbi:hypothetical protein [Shewanella frigidimarina]|uniref:Uncharacterized protein n=1 Tax=Shewanella frigidimarina (strain NCIMB 400) TaxID=318167 RepID=Q083R9_SHEFN|nr:hypothetical protein [Shewanella frigidimarina]ABI71496.1 hypothetical protein Sfri_1645 [Shewanella frigidimarina NCIMB 400]
MILTNTPSTDKQRTEHFHLVSIRFACLLTTKQDPMDCERVALRVAKLERQLMHSNPSQLFSSQFESQAGELGDNLAMRYNHHTGRITIWRNTPLHQSGKVFQLRANV